MKYLTDRKRAEGLGAGGSGTHHHWKMIITSISLVVLVPLFVFVFGCILGGSYTEVQEAFSNPAVAILSALALIVGITHFVMEVNEAVEDYVGGLKRKLTLVAVTAFGYTLMAIGLFALLKLAL